ncbi:uncharacterized protein LOC141696084 [Apium graveolens]|uniref:uncharacterized protein LOC141696084 n=1 Tax=Apium graveolens TaxID=4045 RepID=UPI003D79A2E6
MKLRGRIDNKEVVVLIDPGATHNFISLSLVKLLDIPTDSTGCFRVALGNGEMVKGTGVCRKLSVHLADCVVVCDDFLPLELGSTDVILGIQWLETLGPMVTNWRTQVMKFEMGGSKVTLVGDPSLVRSKITLKAMIKCLRKEGHGFLIESNKVEVVERQLGAVNERMEQIPVGLQPVIKHYQGVFAEPKGLPLSRGHEHHITLKMDSNPVGVRPYRYP